MASLDLNLLRVLAALDTHRNVSRAARSLGRSQPAVSAALAKLRTHFSDPLFLRAGNAMQPTPRAAEAVQAAGSVLRIVDTEIEVPPVFDAALSERPVSLALSDVGEVVMLPRILAMLRSQMPHAQVRSVSLPAAEIAAEMEAGNIDLALGYFPHLAGTSFMQQVLYDDTFACLIRADHPISAPALSIAQFTRLEHVVVHAESRTEEVMERYLARRRISRRVVLTTPHFASAPFIVAQSDLIVTVPQPLARHFAHASANLRVIGLPFAPPKIGLKQFWHRRYHNDARVRWLRARIFDVYSPGRDGPMPIEPAGTRPRSGADGPT